MLFRERCQLCVRKIDFFSPVSACTKKHHITQNCPAYVFTCPRGSCAIAHFHRGAAMVLTRLGLLFSSFELPLGPAPLSQIGRVVLELTAMQCSKDTQLALQKQAGLPEAEVPPNCCAQQSLTSSREQRAHPSTQPCSLTATFQTSQGMKLCHGHVPRAL